MTHAPGRKQEHHPAHAPFHPPFAVLAALRLLEEVPIDHRVSSSFNLMALIVQTAGVQGASHIFDHAQSPGTQAREFSSLLQSWRENHGPEQVEAWLQANGSNPHHAGIATAFAKQSGITTEATAGE